MRWGLVLGLVGLVQSAEADPLTAAREQALERAHAAPITVQLPIDWVAALAERQTVALPPAARAKVAAARQPVLLPSIAGLTAQTFVVLGDGWHTAALDADGVHLEIQGSARATIRADLAAEQAAAGMGTGAPRIARIHHVYTLSFERFGVAYSLDLECASHTDPRCADAGWLMTVYDSLVVAGGRP